MNQAKLLKAKMYKEHFSNISNNIKIKNAKINTNVNMDVNTNINTNVENFKRVSCGHAIQNCNSIKCYND